MVKKPKKDVDEELVHKLAQLLKKTGLTEIEYGCDGWHIRVSSATQQGIHAIPNPHTSPSIENGQSPQPPIEDIDADLNNALKSPMVGIVFTSSDPESLPFVNIGDQVSEGQTLLLIEAMKVFNPIVAPKAGKVTQILITNGAPVEFGEPLMIIK